MKRINILLILSFVGCVFFNCKGSGADPEPEPEEPEYVEQACVMAESIEFPRFFGCGVTLMEGIERNVIQRLVLEDHPLYDTIYTRLEIDHFGTDQTQFPIRIDSVTFIYLICNTLGSLEHPTMWVTELEGTDCQ